MKTFINNQAQEAIIRNNTTVKTTNATHKPGKNKENEPKMNENKETPKTTNDTNNDMDMPDIDWDEDMKDGSNDDEQSNISNKYRNHVHDAFVLEWEEEHAAVGQTWNDLTDQEKLNIIKDKENKHQIYILKKSRATHPGQSNEEHNKWLQVTNKKAPNPRLAMEIKNPSTATTLLMRYKMRMNSFSTRTKNSPLTKNKTLPRRELLTALPGRNLSKQAPRNSAT
jgi:hypothetical protein